MSFCCARLLSPVPLTCHPPFHLAPILDCPGQPSVLRFHFHECPAESASLAHAQSLGLTARTVSHDYPGCPPSAPPPGASPASLGSPSPGCCCASSDYGQLLLLLAFLASCALSWPGHLPVDVVGVGVWWGRLGIEVLEQLPVEVPLGLLAQFQVGTTGGEWEVECVGCVVAGESGATYGLAQSSMSTFSCATSTCCCWATVGL